MRGRLWRELPALCTVTWLCIGTGGNLGIGAGRLPLVFVGEHGNGRGSLPLCSTAGGIKPHHRSGLIKPTGSIRTHGLAGKASLLCPILTRVAGGELKGRTA